MAKPPTAQIQQGLITAMQAPANVTTPVDFHWDALPQIPRSDLPAIMFCPACPPGSGDACPPTQQRYTLVVPWQEIVADTATATKHSWTAPGGNRYFSEQLSADPRDPRVLSLLRMMANISKQQFADEYAASSITMAKLLEYEAQLEQGWKLTYGLLGVDVQPRPEETVAAFVARGGYMLNLRVPHSPFLGKAALQRVGAERWMPDNVRTYDLFATYIPSTGTITYAIRIVYEGQWQQAVNKIGDAIDSVVRQVSFKNLCGLIQDPRAMTAASLATAIPATAPYATGYTLAASLCAQVYAPAPPAPPAPNTPAPPHRPAAADVGQQIVASQGYLAPVVNPPTKSKIWPFAGLLVLGLGVMGSVVVISRSRRRAR